MRNISQDNCPSCKNPLTELALRIDRDMFARMSSDKKFEIWILEQVCMKHRKDIEKQLDDWEAGRR